MAKQTTNLPRGGMEAKRVESGRAFEDAGILHLVHQPTAPPPHPTIIMLQGRQGNEEVMWVFARTIPDNCLILSPRAPTPDGDGFSWHPFSGKLSTYDDLQEPVGSLHRFAKALPSLYEGEYSRLYMMGFSQGAVLALAYALHYPGSLAGVAALVGHMPLGAERFVTELPFADLPIFMAAGIEDDLIPLDLAAYSGDLARRAGADLTYREYETGHRMSGRGMRDLEEWWRTQLPAPK